MQDPKTRVTYFPPAIDSALTSAQVKVSRRAPWHGFAACSNAGTLVRTRAEEVSQMGRNTQGVRLIRLSDDEQLVGLERIVEPEDSGDVADPADEPGSEEESNE